MASGSDRAEAALTIVAPGTRIVGEIEATGVLKIEGVVVGTVRAERQVLVARGGSVEGDVFTAEAVVGGSIKGGVTGSERVEIQSGAVVHGDVSTKQLIVQEGGEVNGLVKMSAGTTDGVSRTGE
jgi:cytoskeletal protein CcmA (bactofilin family)